jgi:mannose-6-phosphate isomerase-like protein (cupin superfamily)
MKKGFKDNIEKLTEENTNFRKVVYTGAHSQLVLMAIPEGEEIGFEVHPDTDQFFRIELGQGKVTINESIYEIQSGDGLVIPAGAKHNLENTGQGMLRLYTIYSPAHHKDGTIHKTKAEAESSHEEFDGVLSE